MGRYTTLIFHKSYMNEENGYNVDNMLFWDVVLKHRDYYLFPKGCKKNGDDLNFENYKDAKSSEEYTKKFDGMVDLNYFPFVSETAINELVDYLKQFENGYLTFIINDDMSGGENNYTIRVNKEKTEINIVIEVIDLDGGTKTVKVELKYTI